jgi:RNA-directed DNA polymerase
MSPKLDRLSELAKEDPKRQSFSTAHLITPEALYAAFVGLKKDASAGVDGVTHEEYQKDAERNIRQLHRRLKDGKYQAQPLRRVTEEIPPVRFDGGPATNQQPDF